MSSKNNSALAKHIGTKELIAFYISSIVGVGVLVIPGYAAQIAAAASFISWVLLSMISIPVALVFSKMAIHFPSSGGIPYFIEKTFNQTLGRSLALLLSFSMVVGNPIMGLASAYYLRDLIN